MDRRVHAHGVRAARARIWCRAKVSLARRYRGHRVQVADALGLTDPLVIAEDENLILANRPSGIGPELITVERRNGPIEKVPRVQGVIA